VSTARRDARIAFGSKAPANGWSGGELARLARPAPSCWINDR
jgi:hypothetical protein